MNSGKVRSSGKRKPFRGRRMRGLFTNGVWYCDCNPRLPAEHFKVKKEGKNQGRWFYTCQKPEEQRCAFFLWDEDAKIREESAVLNNSRTEPRAPLTVGASGRDREQHHSENAKAPEESGSQRESVIKLRADSPSSSHHEESGDEHTKDSDSSLVSEAGLRSLEENAIRSLQQPQLPLEPKTPAKRSHIEMHGLPTPDTIGRQHHSLGYPVSSPSKRRATDVELLNLVSPTTTPTPVRFRDAVGGSGDDTLFAEIEQVLSSHRVKLNADTSKAVKAICHKHTLRMQGVIKGREISRLALNAKDAKILELQRRIDTLEAEHETERAIVRHLLWENEVNDE
ncbi:uncharacterized protein PV09_01884 [Verruconis gallopava]|uniref:GRF-type domain-containing protein n=1 Tax=Verruconis gallopava TaxID=253628 RepID=A0A0D2ANB0_9PEZI|nr:uncharacterized protein PV09_01884 [Verruconis gallopava]KIW07985.1 hypothetical protein PV09_01884 [Verruconis gallopava]